MISSRGERAPPAPPCSRSRAVDHGIPLPLIQRQLGNPNLSTTGTYLKRRLLNGDYLHRLGPAW
jgi:hypothetical protein